MSRVTQPIRSMVWTTSQDDELLPHGIVEPERFMAKFLTDQETIS